jgi:hypothetical protein
MTPFTGQPQRAALHCFVLLVQAAVDLRDLRDPLLSLTVFEPEDLLVRPVKVIGDVRYLLTEPL